MKRVMAKWVLELYVVVVVSPWLYVCQNSYSCVPKRENFTACKFYLSKLKYMYKQAASEVKDSKKLCFLYVFFIVVLFFL